MKDLKACTEAKNNSKEEVANAKDKMLQHIKNTTNESAEEKPLSIDERRIRALNEKFKEVTFDNKLKEIRQNIGNRLSPALKYIANNIGKDELVNRITAATFTGEDADALASYQNGTITLNTLFFGINASKENIEALKDPANSLTVTIYHEQMHHSYSRHFKDDKTIEKFYNDHKEYLVKHFELHSYEEKDRVEEFFVEAMAHLMSGILIEKDNKDPNNKSNNDLYDFIKGKLNLLKPKENEKAK